MLNTGRPKIPNPQPSPDIRRLSPEQMGFFRNQQAIISMQRSILYALENEFTRLAELHLGVDLSKEVWELDLDEGVIRRGPDAQQ